MFCNKCGTTSPEGQQFCKKCGSPFATHHDADAIIGVGQPELLFSVSPLRMLLLTILSMGFYRIFWFYKNWAAVQKIQKLDISPLSDVQIFASSLLIRFPMSTIQFYDSNYHSKLDLP